MAASKDGGETFEPVVCHDLKLHSTYSMSIIEWPLKIDGKTAYVYASSDSRAGNYNGAVKLGFFQDDAEGGHIEWRYSRLFKPGVFGYCFLCPVTDDMLGVVYESSGALHLSFQKMDLNFICSEDDTPLNPVRRSDIFAALRGGNTHYAEVRPTGYADGGTGGIRLL